MATGPTSASFRRKLPRGLRFVGTFHPSPQELLVEDDVLLCEQRMQGEDGSASRQQGRQTVECRFLRVHRFASRDHRIMGCTRTSRFPSYRFRPPRQQVVGHVMREPVDPHFRGGRWYAEDCFRTARFVQQLKRQNTPRVRNSLFRRAQGVTRFWGITRAQNSVTIRATRSIGRGTLWSEADPLIYDSRLRGNDVFTIYDL